MARSVLGSRVARVEDSDLVRGRGTLVSNQRVADTAHAGSRSLQVGGNAVAQAADEVREKALDVASRMLETSPKTA